MMRRGARWLALVLGVGCGGPELLGPDVVGSPNDGLVFGRVGHEGRYDLWRARLADGATRPFVAQPARHENWPFWSQAAGLLVFEVSPRVGRRKTLRLWRARDGAELRFPVAHAGSVYWPAWAPQGDRLAYAVVPAADSAGGLAVLDLASQRTSYLAFNQGRPVDDDGRLEFARPSFAPDGKGLVAQGTDEEGARVYLLEAGRPPRPLTPRGEYAHRAEFTRDGRWVVFTVRGSDKQPSHIAAVRPDGGGRHRLADAPRASNERAKPSPTRDEIAFVSDRDGQLDVFLMDLAGGAPRNLTRDLDLDAGPLRWSPDGERIAVATEPRGARASGRRSRADEWWIVVIDRDGRELLRTPGFSPDWMPPWP